MKKPLVFLVACVGLALAGCSATTKADPNVGGKLDTFAQCLADKGLKMYGTSRCPHCQKMKASFGSAFAKIPFVDCDEQSVQCDAAGVKVYPTRSYNGEKIVGEKTHEELAKLVGCEAPAK